MVIAFAQQYLAEAVLLFNAEEILKRWRNGEIIFDTSVHFEEDPNLAAIVSQHRQETLDQPFRWARSEMVHRPMAECCGPAKSGVISLAASTADHPPPQ